MPYVLKICWAGWIRVGDQVLGRRVPSAILASIFSCQSTMDEQNTNKVVSAVPNEGTKCPIVCGRP